MDETAKTEARNYLSAAGFFLIAAWFLVYLFSRVGTTRFAGQNDAINIALGIGLIIVATLLIILHKRDMMALLFFMMGVLQVFFACTPPRIWNTIFVGFILLIALVTLTGQDKKKWMLFLIPAIWFVFGLVVELIGYKSYLFIAFFSILAVISLYYAFCCACERCRLPGAKTLTADAATDVKSSGSVLGYMLFALITGGYTLHYILGESVIPLETFVTMELISGVLMIFVAILLLTVGRMRFTPVMFLLLGITSIIAMYCSGAMFIGIGILFIIIGLFAMLRKDSRILPGIMLIVYGCTVFFTAYAGGNTPVVSAILNAIPCLIAIYLAFVVYSQKKLPRF